MTEEKKGKIMNLKLLWYCTKAKGKNYYLRKLPNGRYCLSRDKGELLNDKIVAKCDFEVEEMKFKMKYTAEKSWNVYLTPSLSLYELKERSCLNNAILDNYKPNYAIHIKNLKVFKKPKELKDFYVKGTYHNAEQMFIDEIQIDGEWFHPMKRAPQNMCYAYDIHGNKYVVISIHPEWACKILNGEKTIEVRRKVLKEMIPCK